MPNTSSARPPSSPTFMDPALMPWALVSEVYWMAWKLLEAALRGIGDRLRQPSLSWRHTILTP